MNNLRGLAENPLDVFIKGWGRMGVCWGVGKVMAEIQALLYTSARPLSLGEMSERLKTSRSNISLNVRALQDLGVVRKVIIQGDRKDYYTAEVDVEKVARRLAAAKKKRELDPAIEFVTRAIEAAGALDNRDSSDGNGNPAGELDSVVTDRLLQLKSLMEKIGVIMDMFIDDEVTELRQRNATEVQKA
ncbi:MAG: hypothetical protein JSW58_11630 [Candidatus Latescibacterota bacterium]|nr:MAG: hypothetical protein JSW58_11630 [Candidatus Latescibacterota bacterium]